MLGMVLTSNGTWAHRNSSDRIDRLTQHHESSLTTTRSNYHITYMAFFIYNNTGLSYKNLVCCLKTSLIPSIYSLHRTATLWLNSVEARPTEILSTGRGKGGTEEFGCRVGVAYLLGRDWL